MSKNTYIVIAVIVVAAFGGWFLLQSNEAPIVQQQEESGDHGAPSSHTVTYTDEGYSPREITIEHEDTVVFVNESLTEMWPATAIHPTHTIYPGSDITKCATQGGMFDACGPVEQGGSWSFRFDEHGAWGFHDHLNVSNTGRITVE